MATDLSYLNGFPSLVAAAGLDFEMNPFLYRGGGVFLLDLDSDHSVQAYFENELLAHGIELQRLRNGERFVAVDVRRAKTIEEQAQRRQEVDNRTASSSLKAINYFDEQYDDGYNYGGDDNIELQHGFDMAGSYFSQSREFSASDLMGRSSPLNKSTSAPTFSLRFSTESVLKERIANLTGDAASLRAEEKKIELEIENATNKWKDLYKKKRFLSNANIGVHHAPGEVVDHHISVEISIIALEMQTIKADIEDLKRKKFYTRTERKRKTALAASISDECAADAHRIALQAKVSRQMYKKGLVPTLEILSGLSEKAVLREHRQASLKASKLKAEAELAAYNSSHSQDASSASQTEAVKKAKKRQAKRPAKLRALVAQAGEGEGGKEGEGEGKGGREGGGEGGGEGDIALDEVAMPIVAVEAVDAEASSEGMSTPVRNELQVATTFVTALLARFSPSVADDSSDASIRRVIMVKAMSLVNVAVVAAVATATAAAISIELEGEAYEEDEEREGEGRDLDIAMNRGEDEDVEEGDGEEGGQDEEWIEVASNSTTDNRLNVNTDFSDRQQSDATDNDGQLQQQLQQSVRVGYRVNVPSFKDVRFQQGLRPVPVTYLIELTDPVGQSSTHYKSFSQLNSMHKQLIAVFDAITAAANEVVVTQTAVSSSPLPALTTATATVTSGRNSISQSSSTKSMKSPSSTKSPTGAISAKAAPPSNKLRASSISPLPSPKTPYSATRNTLSLSLSPGPRSATGSASGSPSASSRLLPGLSVPVPAPTLTPVPTLVLPPAIAVLVPQKSHFMERAAAIQLYLQSLFDQQELLSEDALAVVSGFFDFTDIMDPIGPDEGSTGMADY